MNSIQILFKNAMQLTKAEKLLLVDELLFSLEPAEDSRAKWYEEASARLQAYDKGLEKAQSIESVLAEIKTKYGY